MSGVYVLVCALSALLTVSIYEVAPPHSPWVFGVGLPAFVLLVGFVITVILDLTAWEKS